MRVQWPLYRATSWPVPTATQNPARGHETETRRWLLTVTGVDQWPACQREASPLLVTAMQNRAVGHETLRTPRPMGSTRRAGDHAPATMKTDWLRPSPTTQKAGDAHEIVGAEVEFAEVEFAIVLMTAGWLQDAPLYRNTSPKNPTASQKVVVGQLTADRAVRTPRLSGRLHAEPFHWKTLPLTSVAIQNSGVGQETETRLPPVARGAGGVQWRPVHTDQLPFVMVMQNVGSAQDTAVATGADAANHVPGGRCAA